MEKAPFHSDIAAGPQGGSAHWLATSDGVRIRAAHWTGEDMKGTILIFPGRTEYIEKYGRAADEFLSRGYACVAVDWRGQGLAGRTHPKRSYGDVRKFTDYQADVAALTAHVRDLGLPKPYYLLGHSMGGCIGLRALNDGLAVKAASFSAPMWGITMSPVLRPFAWVVSTLSRKLGFEEMLSPGQVEETFVEQVLFADNTLTSDPEMFEILQAQAKARPELTLGGPTLRWLNESLREMRQLSHTPSPNTPCLTFLGTDEEIVDPARIRNRMATWTNGHLEVIEGAKHELLMETPEIRAHVFDAICAHFDQHR